jgi:aromatic-L-amino-acid decarboxylase
VAFRAVWPGLGPAETNARNRGLLEAVNRRRRVYLTGTTVRDRFLLRICVLSFRTHRDRVAEGLADIREALGQVAG